MSTLPLAARMARAARAMTWQNFSRARQARARRCVVDFLACVQAGARLTEVQPVLLLAAEGDVFIEGFARGFTPGGAALVAGTAGALLQVHDAFPEGGNHPSSTIIPAVMALRSQSSVSLEGALTALIAGYEAANHIAVAGYPAQQQAGITPTAIAGAIGACLAAGLMLDLDEPRLAAAIGLTALLAPAAPFQALIEHGDATPLHGGLAARAGVEAALLAKAGASAGACILEGQSGTPGWLAMLHINPDRLVPETWDGATIERVIWKLFPACFSCQMSVETALRAPVLDTEEIVAVEIDLPPGAMALVGEGPRPQHALYDRLMSVKWSTAYALAHRDYNVFTANARASPRVAALLARTRVHVCAALDDLPAGSVGGQIRILLRNGERRVLRHSRSIHGPPSDQGPSGWCANPDDAALDRKIVDLVGRPISSSEVLARFDRSDVLPGGGA